MSKRRVITAGIERAIDPYVPSVYEKTTDNSELVAGRVGKRGTADKQVKLYTAGTKPVCWFDIQRKHQGLDSNSYEDSDYAYEAKPVDTKVGGDFVVEGLLLSGQTVTLGDEVMGTTLGKVVLRGNGAVWDPAVGIALETVTASGDTVIRLLNKIGGNGSTILKKTETLTVTTYQVTMTYIPYMLEYVDVATGTLLGGKLLRTTGTYTNAGNLPTGHCHLARTTKVITFSSTDAPLTVTVEYLYNA